MFGRLKSFFRAERRATDSGDLDDRWYPLTDLVRKVFSGQTVTPAAAMSSGSVLACLRVLAETVAALPLITYRDLGSGSGHERARELSLYNLLHTSPNPEMTSFEWRECGMLHLLLNGKWYSQLVRSNVGDIIEIWPLNPWMIKRHRREDGSLYYRYQKPDGGIREFEQDEILEVVGPFGGKSLVDIAAESVGLSLAAERYGAGFFGSDGRPGGAFELDGTMEAEDKKRFIKEWMKVHGPNSENRKQPAVLDQGMKWKAIGVPPEDAQFLETRKFQRSEVAGWLRVPPHMIADLENATFSNIEHQGILFVVHTMVPWLVRIEQTFKRDLFGVESPFYAEFLVKGLLRGDAESRAKFYRLMRDMGVYSANDIRELENENPLPGTQGDAYLVQVNMANLQDVADGTVGAAAKQSEPSLPANGAAARHYLALEALKAKGWTNGTSDNTTTD